HLKDAFALVIPPPTGSFKMISIFGGEWIQDDGSMLTRDEINGILTFLNSGGRLLAFSYRFGDSFSKTNLSELFTGLGWLLNNDAVIDLRFAGKEHPLYTTFETAAEDIMQRWAVEGIKTVRWRPVTTFRRLPNATGQPLVYPPASTASFNLDNHLIAYERNPICVFGEYGAGRYVLIGGPHAFEETEFGFLVLPGNSRLLSNILRWLLDCENSIDSMDTVSKPSKFQKKHHSNRRNCEMKTLWETVCNSKNCDNSYKEESFVNFVSYLLKDTKILRPLARSAWSSDRESELDLVYECISRKPLWARSQGVVPIECKNWSSKVGAPEITRFAEKVDRTGSKIGIFATRKCTKAAWSAVVKSRLRHDTLIGLLNDDDFEAYLKGSTSAETLVEASLVRSILL
ncbi:restriction endonuclease, partial [Acidobacteriota bacterium]